MTGATSSKKQNIERKRDDGDNEFEKKRKQKNEKRVASDAYRSGTARGDAASSDAYGSGTTKSDVATSDADGSGTAKNDAATNAYRSSTA